MKIPKSFIPNKKKLDDMILELQKKVGKDGPERVCLFCKHSYFKACQSDANHLYCHVREEPVFPSFTCEAYKPE